MSDLVKKCGWKEPSKTGSRERNGDLGINGYKAVGCDRCNGYNIRCPAHPDYRTDCKPSTKEVER